MDPSQQKGKGKQRASFVTRDEGAREDNRGRAPRFPSTSTPAAAFESPRPAPPPTPKSVAALEAVGICHGPETAHGKNRASQVEAESSSAPRRRGLLRRLFIRRESQVSEEREPERGVPCVPEPVRLGSQYGQYSDSQHWATRLAEQQRLRREVPSWYSGESSQFAVRGLASVAKQEAATAIGAGASEGDSSGRSTPFYFDDYLGASSRAEANTRHSYPTSSHSTSPHRRHPYYNISNIITNLPIQREESTRSPEERREHHDRAQRLLERGPSNSSLLSTTSFTGRRHTHLAVPHSTYDRIQREESVRSPEDRRAQFERAQRHLEGRRSKTASEEERLFQKELEESGKTLVRRHGFPPP